MPTYDYRCEACGHSFELFQSIKADPVTTCPECREERVRRVIGAGGGFIFKGSGFYITDYARSSDYKEKSKADGGGGGAASNASPAKTEPAKTDGKAASDTGGGGKKAEATAAA